MINQKQILAMILNNTYRKIKNDDIMNKLFLTGISFSKSWLYMDTDNVIFLFYDLQNELIDSAFGC